MTGSASQVLLTYSGPADAALPQKEDCSSSGAEVRSRPDPDVRSEWSRLRPILIFRCPPLGDCERGLCPRCTADAVRRTGATGTSPPPITSARFSFRLTWQSSGSSGKTCLVRAHLLPVVVERFRRGVKRRGTQVATQGLALECQAGFDLFADHSLASLAAALPPTANFMARSPITEEASNPNEQASAQIPSHEFRARDLFRIITSHKEQDIILAGGRGGHMLAY